MRMNVGLLGFGFVLAFSSLAGAGGEPCSNSLSRWYLNESLYDGTAKERLERLRLLEATSDLRVGHHLVSISISDMLSYLLHGKVPSLSKKGGSSGIFFEVYEPDVPKGNQPRKPVFLTGLLATGRDERRLLDSVLKVLNSTRHDSIH